MQTDSYFYYFKYDVRTSIGSGSSPFVFSPSISQPTTASVGLILWLRLKGKSNKIINSKPQPTRFVQRTRQAMSSVTEAPRSPWLSHAEKTSPATATFLCVPTAAALRERKRRTRQRNFNTLWWKLCLKIMSETVTQGLSNYNRSSQRINRQKKVMGDLQLGFAYL